LDGERIIAPTRPESGNRLTRLAARVRQDRVMTATLALAVTTRFALVGVMWLSLRAMPRLPRYPGQYPDDFFPNHPLLDGWARWDAAHYVALAQHGYGGDNPSPHGGLGFFPLYSLLMRGLVELVRATPTPAHLAFAGLVIANICFLIAVPLLAKLGAGVFGETAGINAALLLCIAPLGFFFNAAYTESLFFLLSVGSLFLAGRGRWWWAGLIAGLAAGTRLVGLAFAPSLLFFAWRRRAPLRDLLGVAILSPLGAVIYAVYCWIWFDTPLAYFDAQATWGGWDEHVRFYFDLFLHRPGDALRGDPRHLVIIFNVALALLFLAFLPLVWRRLDPGIALFTTLLVVVQTAFTWVSLGRYLLPAFSVYLVAGALLSQPRWSGWPRDALITASAILLAVFAVLYGHGFWVV
jgi:hypothetical protein